jgi:NADH-quinone oxidoreductase subunit A
MLTIGAIIGGLLAVSLILSARIRSTAKLSAYECGLEPVGDARVKLKIIYWVIGILYLLFDLEIVLCYPLAVSLT